MKKQTNAHTIKCPPSGGNEHRAHTPKKPQIAPWARGGQRAEEDEKQHAVPAPGAESRRKKEQTEKEHEQRRDLAHGAGTSDC